MMRDEICGMPFRFKKGATIGEPDAESDERFLSECFTDTGDFESLRDCDNPQRIIIGRTGTGKSALIRQLQRTEEHVISIPPENLALNFISNSDILVTLEKAGVKLDIFYTLLWKHVLAVELLRNKYQLTNEEKTRTWCDGFLQRFRKTDKTKELALAYLHDWGDKFWQETEYRIKEVTQKLEQDVSVQLGGDFDFLKTQVGATTKEAQEKKAEILHKAQTVVNKVQIKALSDVIRFLADDVFDDPKQKYYVVIDKLDEGWVDDNLRYRLIRALIETVKSFRSIANVKVIIALRLDLVRTVFEKTRDSGFQQEKYQSLFLHIRWEANSLERLLDNRVAMLVREQYRQRPVKMRELFPENVGRLKVMDYILQRTLFRPRDAIAFVNECLARSAGKGKVTAQAVKDAEMAYSASRIDAICYEWFTHFPLLQDYLPIIEKMPHSFRLTAIPKERIDDFCLKHSLQDELRDPVASAGHTYLNGGSIHQFIIVLVKALYEVGILGIKPDSFTGQMWSFQDTRVPSDGQIKPSSEVYIHPVAWSRCGTLPKNDERRHRR